MNKLLTAVALAVLAGLFGWVATDGRNPWAKPPAHGADWCEAHGVELSKCEACNPRLRRGGTFTTALREAKEGECPNTLVKVTLAPGSAEAAGVATEEVRAREVAEVLRANAETAYAPARYARVGPRVAGIVREVRVALGGAVAAGEALAVVESAEFATAKSELLAARSLHELRQRARDRLKDLEERRLIAAREVVEAETALEEARLGRDRAELALRGFGLGEEQVKKVAETRDVSPLIEVPSPLDGVVVAAAAVVGERATPEAALFEVAGLEKLWISIDVHEAELSRVAAGQKVVFGVAGFPGKRFTGKVVAVGGAADERTRMVPVHAEVKNPEGLLRARMFGQAEVQVKGGEAKLLLPKEALQSDGDCSLVFVKTGAETYQARKVEIGVAYEGGYEVTAGLVAGEVVATTGAFLLRTEVLRGQMGAG